MQWRLTLPPLVGTVCKTILESGCSLERSKVDKRAGAMCTQRVVCTAFKGMHCVCTACKCPEWTEATAVVASLSTILKTSSVFCRCFVFWKSSTKVWKTAVSRGGESLSRIPMHGDRRYAPFLLDLPTRPTSMNFNNVASVLCTYLGGFHSVLSGFLRFATKKKRKKKVLAFL